MRIRRGMSTADTARLQSEASGYRPRLQDSPVTPPRAVLIRRIFHPRQNMTLSAQAEVFNVINVNTVLTESETLGTSVAQYLPGGIGGQPSAITNPRMLRFALQFKF